LDLVRPLEEVDDVCRKALRSLHVAPACIFHARADTHGSSGPEMTCIEALFLDLNDTLVDGSGLPSAIQRTCREIAAIQPGVDVAQVLAAVAEVWRTYWPSAEPG